jgi:septum formation protein
MPNSPLILASTSPYRRALLERLKLPFEVADPAIDESYKAGESPVVLALRLAREKALAVAGRFPNALIIGSDQVAVLDGQPLSKPGNHVNAVTQLRAMRGKRIEFLTALTVHDSARNQTSERLVPFAVCFRSYSDEQIERYLQLEKPYDCAGSAKAEALGIALIAKMEGEDSTALIGLPLIALIDLLAEHGFQVL